jgi:hypothetical protein
MVVAIPTRYRQVWGPGGTLLMIGTGHGPEDCRGCAWTRNITVISREV